MKKKYERTEKHFKITVIKNPGEALSTFIRALRDRKGETQLRVANSTKVGILRPKIMPQHFLNNSKTTLKKSRKRLFDPQNGRKLPLKTAKMSKILIQNFDFGAHLSTFQA